MYATGSIHSAHEVIQSSSPYSNFFAAAASVHMNDTLMDEVVNHLLQRLKTGQKTTKLDVLRSYMAAVGHVRCV